VAATSYTVVSATQITAVSPAEAAGTHGIVITTPSGTSGYTNAELFTFEGPPAITSISPAAGPIAGGTTVTINGSNFTGTSKVLFGSVAATSYTVVSSTQITAVSPAEAAGTHGIVITATGGTSAYTNAELFSFDAVPTVTGLSPSSGAPGGGTTVTITGTGFTGATKVLFGTVAATSYSVVSSTQITAVTPAQSAGTHTVFVTTPGGTNATSSAATFTVT